MDTLRLVFNDSLFLLAFLNNNIFKKRPIIQLSHNNKLQTKEKISDLIALFAPLVIAFHCLSFSFAPFVAFETPCLWNLLAWLPLRITGLPFPLLYFLAVVSLSKSCIQPHQRADKNNANNNKPICRLCQSRKA